MPPQRGVFRGDHLQRSGIRLTDQRHTPRPKPDDSTRGHQFRVNLADEVVLPFRGETELDVFPRAIFVGVRSISERFRGTAVTVIGLLITLTATGVDSLLGTSRHGRFRCTANVWTGQRVGKAN